MVWEQLLREIDTKFAQFWVSREHQGVESQGYNFGNWSYLGVGAGISNLSQFSRISDQVLLLIEVRGQKQINKIKFTAWTWLLLSDAHVAVYGLKPHCRNQSNRLKLSSCVPQIGAEHDTFTCYSIQAFSCWMKWHRYFTIPSHSQSENMRRPAVRRKLWGNQSFLFLRVVPP